MLNTNNYLYIQIGFDAGNRTDYLSVLHESDELLNRDDLSNIGIGGQCFSQYSIPSSIQSRFPKFHLSNLSDENFENLNLYSKYPGKLKLTMCITSHGYCIRNK